jgi:AraC-like DNA-binding protein
MGRKGIAVLQRPTTGGLQVLDVLTALRAIGVDPDSSCHAVGLRPRSLNDGARVPVDQVAALFAELERRTRDPLIGLHAGARAEPRGTLAYLLISSPRLEDGLRNACRFAALAVDTLRMSLDIRNDTARFVHDLGDEIVAGNRHIVDYLLMANVRSLRRAASGEVRLRGVHVRHSDPGAAAEAERVFGCAVRFAQRENCVLFPAEDLRAVPRIANPVVAGQIEKFAAALLSGMARRVTFRERVADVARSLLAAGVRIDRATLARRLGMSHRTLQRRLANQRTTFKAVRDRVLWEVVEALMSNPALKVETIAISAGFGDAAAFSKAFKRWAGCTPTSYRERLAARAVRRLG